MTDRLDQRLQSARSLHGDMTAGHLGCALTQTTIDELLADARPRLTRLGPAQALQAMRAEAVLIAVRSDSQIARDGTIAGALVIPRNALEWQLDPASQLRPLRAAPRRSGHPALR